MKERIAVSALLNCENENLTPKSNMKPYRKRIGRLQIIELQRLFDNGIKFPDKNLREKLSEKLKLTPRTIQVWFQNRRQNIKEHNVNNDIQMVSILQSLRTAFK